jgi:hypothetical protein
VVAPFLVVGNPFSLNSLMILISTKPFVKMRGGQKILHKVDWSAMQSCMSRFFRVQQIAYGKLLHGILNTNVQNNKFYNHSSLCPVCLAEPESFLHVVTCTHPETVQHRSDQWLTLWKALTGIQTPPAVLPEIRSVIIDDARDNDSTLNSTASVRSSTLSRSASHAFELMIQAAVYQQITDLGREHFYRGRVSLLWKEAAFLESLHLGIGLDKQRWAAGMVSALLRYSHALWHFRCKVVHGHSRLKSIGANWKVFAFRLHRHMKPSLQIHLLLLVTLDTFFIPLFLTDCSRMWIFYSFSKPHTNWQSRNRPCTV